MGIPQVRHIRANPMRYYERLFRQYGDTVSMKFGPMYAFAFFHPDQIKEVLITKAKQLRRFPRPLEVLAQWNGKHSLIVVEGDEWLRQRRLAQPAFHPRRFQKYGDEIVALTKRWIQQYENRGTPFDLVQTMTEFVLVLSSRVLFSVDIDVEAPRLCEALQILGPVAYDEFTKPFTLPDWLPLPGKAKKRWAIRYVDETVSKIIVNWRAEGRDRGDLLSMFLLAVDEEANGRSMSDVEARDSLVTMLVAGIDTVASGLSWIWYVLATHPDVEAQVVEEVETEIGDRTPTFTDLPRLTFTERVIKETMRLYPPVPILFTRQTLAEVEIGGYSLPANSLVQVFPGITQKDPRWFPDPEKFDPERFTAERLEGLPQFAYFPFGGGPRVCIGNTLAMLMMTLTTATVLQRLQIRFAPSQGAVQQQVIMSLRPKGIVRMMATRRERMALAGV
jgi:cytochrome P450